MLWRLHLRTTPKNGKTQDDVVDFCIRNNVAGMGWPVDKLPLSVSEYADLARTKYGNRPASVSFAEYPKLDDLIWARSKVGQYYLGRVKSEWFYSNETLHLDLDIPNQRHCNWIEITGEDYVPGKVIACFRPQRAFQSIADQSMLERSERIYASSTTAIGEPRSIATQPLTSSEFFKLIGTDDCEDIVGLYLQKRLGYCLIPSTCKRATIGIEFLLKHNETGLTAAVQVKQGRVSLDERLKTSANHIFLFSTEGVVPVNSSRITVLSAMELYDFVLRNNHLMPGRILYWLHPFPKLQLD